MNQGVGLPDRRPLVPRAVYISARRPIALGLNRGTPMKVTKRILAGVALVLAVAGLLLGIAGGVGVWIVKGPATVKAARVFERIEAGLDAADQGLDHVKTSLARAGDRLDSAREEQRKLAQQPQPNNALRRAMARTVQRTVAPEIGNAHQKLHTVAEAAVVVNSVLEDVGNIPFLSVSGLDVDSLAEMNGRLADLGPAAWELSRLFGEPAPGPDADADVQLSRVEGALTALRGSVAQYEPRLTEARQRTEALRSRTLPWIPPATVLISAVCFWIALSQVSVMVHAWSWWKQLGTNDPRPS